MLRRADFLLALGGLVALAAAAVTALAGSSVGFVVLAGMLALAMVGLALDYRTLLAEVARVAGIAGATLRTKEDARAGIDGRNDVVTDYPRARKPA